MCRKRDESMDRTYIYNKFSTFFTGPELNIRHSIRYGQKHREREQISDEGTSTTQDASHSVKRGDLNVLTQYLVRLVDDDLVSVIHGIQHSVPVNGDGCLPVMGILQITVSPSCRQCLRD